MILIVEGVDRVGKTTLVNKITENCHIKPFIDSYLKFSYFDLKCNQENIVKGDRNCIIANTEKINSLVNFYEQFYDKITDVIFDRLHLSEFVYGMCDREYTSFEAFKILDEKLAKLNALIIYIEPKDLEWSSNKHGSNLEHHYNTFEYILNETKCEVIRCNFDTLDEVVSKIKERVTNNGSC